MKNAKMVNFYFGLEMFPKCQCQYILQFVCESVVCLTFLTFLYANVSIYDASERASRFIYASSYIGKHKETRKIREKERNAHSESLRG